ncbi:unnamed protein product [Aphanomyces euteiches]
MNPINLDVENAKSAPMQTASHENLPYAIAITRTRAIARMTESHWSSVLFEHDDSEDDAKDGVDEAAEARFNDVVVGDAPQEKAPHATDRPTTSAFRLERRVEEHFQVGLPQKNGMRIATHNV